MTTRRFNVYVAYYDHTDTIVCEDVVVIRARDEEHAETLALRSREWNFAAIQRPSVSAPSTMGVEMDLSIMGR